jgi:ribonuclease D
MSLHPEIITTTEALQQLCQRLDKEPILAVDLEADSMHHYREKVCLIQVSSEVETVLVDPLACPDLSPFGPLLADPAILKVMHGSDYDIRSFHRDFGFTVVNLFDTMIAAQFLGEGEIGLAALLKKRFGVELDKQYQKADWSRRPLEAGMIEYAARDTAHLIDLYRQMNGELVSRGRLEWVQEECRLLCGVRKTEREDGPLFLRFKGAAQLEPRALVVLEELLRFRDESAQRRDVPPFKILGSDALRELALRRPMGRDELAGVPGMTERVVERWGKGIMASVATAMACAEGDLPRYPRREREERDPAVEKRLKRLKSWREERAARMGMAPGIMANNALLEAVAAAMPRTRDELAALAGMKQWQLEEFGEELLSRAGGR